MKKLLDAALFLVAATTGITGLGILLVLAITEELPPPHTPTITLDSPIGGEGPSEEFDVDRLRDLCKVQWPSSIAGARTEEARRKACRAFGE